MKATMSSFSERRSSVLIVKYPFSQMGVGRGSGKLSGRDAAGSDWRDPRGDETRDGHRDGHGDQVVTLEGIELRRIAACPHLNATSLSATTSAPPMHRGPPAHAMEQANCIRGCNNCHATPGWAAR